VVTSRPVRPRVCLGRSGISQSAPSSPGDKGILSGGSAIIEPMTRRRGVARSVVVTKRRSTEIGYCELHAASILEASDLEASGGA
jgi:hypothetical protein